MIAPIPFEPARFRSAAEHYQAGRAPYPTSLIQRVAATIGLRPTHRLLDLGCGPGPLAIAFAPLVAEVVALDPEPAMLEAGRAAAVDCPNIHFVQGSSYDLPADFGRFSLVTMGRSFHWMDRVDTLRRLDGMIEPGGAIALFNDSQPDVPDNAWRQDYEAVLARHAENGRRRGWRSTGWVRHEAVLMDSPFNRLETASVIHRRRVPVERLIDRALSMSSTSRARIGDRAADAMMAELQEVFMRIAPEGIVTEMAETTALLAWRAD